MAQNIYDANPFFFAEYSKLPRSRDGLSSAPEWPTLQAMLQDIRGLRVLELGCGFGWFCRWAREHGGAAGVHGIDLSANMLARAAEFGVDPEAAITYERADLEDVRLAPPDDAPGNAPYGAVYSSLTFHYVRDLERLFGEVRRVLRPGGRFVFSVEHPIYTAPTNPGWYENDAGAGEECWLLNAYSEEGARITNWLTADGVRKYHRTAQTYISLLLRNGFTLVDFVEWAPTDEHLREFPQWAKDRERPMFLLVAAEKTS